MKHAVHIVGLRTWDMGALINTHLPPARKAEIYARAQATYGAICAEGYLRPAGMDILTANPGQPTRMFAEDILAGDGRYVFLSLERWCNTGWPDLDYGFVFDAEQLIQQGAILRKYDLRLDYGDLLEECVLAVLPARDEEEWTAEEYMSLFAALESGEADYVSPNAAYYNLMDAVYRNDLRVPHVAEVMAAFREQVAALHATAQLTGAAALAAVRAAGPDNTYEILVPDRLGLTGAVAHIIAGKEVPVSWL